jgi:hypothetical protein
MSANLHRTRKNALASRRGNIIVFSAFLMVAMMAMLALSVDVGYMCAMKAQLQRAVDAAALAGLRHHVDLLAAGAPIALDAHALETIAERAGAGVPRAALVRRDRTTDAAFSGVLELDALRPTGIALQSVALRIDDNTWRLTRPSTVRWGDLTEISVDSLVLARTGAEQGLISVDGHLPPTGVVAFTVQLANVYVG